MVGFCPPSPPGPRRKLSPRCPGHPHISRQADNLIVVLPQDHARRPQPDLADRYTCLGQQPRGMAEFSDHPIGFRFQPAKRSRGMPVPAFSAIDPGHRKAFAPLERPLELAFHPDRVPLPVNAFLRLKDPQFGSGMRMPPSANKSQIHVFFLAEHRPACLLASFMEWAPPASRSDRVRGTGDCELQVEEKHTRNPKIGS